MMGLIKIEERATKVTVDRDRELSLRYSKRIANKYLLKNIHVENDIL